MHSRGFPGFTVVTKTERIIADNSILIVASLALSGAIGLSFGQIFTNCVRQEEMTSSYSEKPAPLASGTPEHVDKLRAVFNICRRMSTMTDLASLQALITREAKELLQAERVSVFLFDRDNCELWSAISQEGRIMRFDARLGIAGAVAMTGQTINVADAYEHPLFYKEVDTQTGYRTQTLLAVPLHDLDGNIIGVGEATNKLVGILPTKMARF